MVVSCRAPQNNSNTPHVCRIGTSSSIFLVIRSLHPAHIILTLDLDPPSRIWVGSATIPAHLGKRSVSRSVSLSILVGLIGLNTKINPKHEQQDQKIFDQGSFVT
jgi:hypothetical protein